MKDIGTLHILITSFIIIITGCATAEDVQVTDASADEYCTYNKKAQTNKYSGFSYADIVGKSFYWTGDDDSKGLIPLLVKFREDCQLHADRGFVDFGSKPSIKARWLLTQNGSVRIPDWSDEFSLIQTTPEAHEICWESFSTCEGEGSSRAEGGVRRLFFTEDSATDYFNSL